MNRPKKTRFLPLFMAALILALSVVPVSAMEDLSDLGGFSDIVDVGEDVSWGDGQDFTITSNDQENGGRPESGNANSGYVWQDDKQQLENPLSVGGSESASESGESSAATDTAAASPGMDSPASYSFSADMSGGAALYSTRASSQTTIYMQRDTSIQHKYPFNGGNMSPAYIFTTADGKAAYCIEPARWNSVNGDVVTGSATYGGLSASQQKEIARAIAANPSGASNHAYYMACQAIIWETAYGQSHGSGSVYNAVIAANSGKLSSAYHDILSKMTAGGEIPSFMSPDPKNPTHHDMTDNGDGSWSIDLTNSAKRF